MIRIGACISPAQLEAALAAGCQYVELGFAATADMPEADFEDLKKRVAASSISVEAMNSFIPGRFRITGPGADHGAIRPFLMDGFQRARALGVDVVVFGSSAARNMPEGFTDKAAATAQCADFLRMAAPLAADAGLRIAIEPLSRGEANLINTVEEGVALARMVNMENVGVLADLYHMLANGEGWEGIHDAGPLLWHCHISHRDRTLPRPGDGEDYRAFFDVLKAIGYRGRVSTEAIAKDFAAEIGPALEVLREAMA